MREYQLDRMIWIRDKARVFGSLTIREIVDHFGIARMQAIIDVRLMVEYDRDFQFNEETGTITPCRATF